MNRVTVLALLAIAFAAAAGAVGAPQPSGPSTVRRPLGKRLTDMERR